jgi:hypothetical protein
MAHTHVACLQPVCMGMALADIETPRVCSRVDHRMPMRACRCWCSRMCQRWSDGSTQATGLCGSSRDWLCWHSTAQQAGKPHWHWIPPGSWAAIQRLSWQHQLLMCGVLQGSEQLVDVYAGCLLVPGRRWSSGVSLGPQVGV